MNATIETARAGQAGKGFAVVAHEVNGTVQQEARAMDEMGAVQHGTRQAAARIRELTTAIEQVTMIAGIGDVHDHPQRLTNLGWHGVGDDEHR